MADRIGCFAFGRRAALLGSAAAVFVSRTGSRAATSRLGGAGLGAPVEILEDGHGVPHVRAANIADAFWADGWLAARDRLWDIDFGRRRALGLLAEVFGADFAASDEASRLFLFRGDARAELDSLPAVVREAASAYVAGINARIGEIQAGTAALPPEFAVLGYRPLRWDVLDLIRMRAEVTGNTEGEIRRARLLARGALGYDALSVPLEPAHEPIIPDGLDAAAVSDADLGLFRILRAGPPIGAIHPGETDHRRANAGSNSWVIAASRTASGRPILANDPHLGFGIPGPRHVVHLSAPGLDVIGGGGAGMPGVMQGHNAHIAFGRTNFHIDQEDLFILRTDPDDPGRYWHNGAWTPMQVRTERLAVKGEPDREITLRYAAQGPVVSADPARHRAVAVAATWLYPGANGALANIGINLATDWDSFRAALRLHTSPTNFTYADTTGRIGWQAAGGVPARAEGHDGLLPAPGDGRHDWRGLQGLDALPNVLDPAAGFFETSNEMNLPPDYPAAERRVSFEWRDRFRHQRASEVLAATERATLADSAALQLDTLSLPAGPLIALLPAVPPDLAAEAELLRGWDLCVTAGSAAAALFEVWWTHLERLLHDRLIPADLHELLAAPLSATVMLAILRAPDGRLGADPVAARDAMLRDALRSAVQLLRARLGALPAAWRWGALHSVTLHHPLSRIAGIAKVFPKIGGPQAESGGDSYTVGARWYNPRRKGDDAYVATGGASYRMVCDVGDWDRSLYVNFPGQSSDPGSPHYADGFADWLAGRLWPMPFSRRAVDAAAHRRFVLSPAAER